jgi:hypothetical protein
VKNEELLKVVYACVIKHGRLTTGDWSYYGSGWEPVTKVNIKKENIVLEKEIVLKRIREIGINWSRMQEPNTERRDSFNGTFAEDAAYTECSLGKVILKNGEIHYFGTMEPVPFSSTMLEIYELVSDPEAVKKIVGE